MTALVVFILFLGVSVYMLCHDPDELNPTVAKVLGYSYAIGALLMISLLVNAL